MGRAMNRLLVRALRAARSSDDVPEDLSIRSDDIEPSLSRVNSKSTWPP